MLTMPSVKRTDEWELVHRQMMWGTIPERNFVKWVEDTYQGDVRRAVSFLEVGCGVGAQALWLAERGHTVRAVDVSPTAIQRLDARIMQAGETHRIITEVADVTSRQYEASSFDCIVDICSLQHVSESDAIMVAQRARHWLKPRGWLYMKQAIEPFDRTLNRVSFIRCGDLTTIQKMFTGYPVVKIDMIREIVRGDKEVFHIIVKAQVKI